MSKGAFIAVAIGIASVGLVKFLATDVGAGSQTRLSIDELRVREMRVGDQIVIADFGGVAGVWINGKDGTPAMVIYHHESHGPVVGIYDRETRLWGVARFQDSGDRRTLQGLIDRAGEIVVRQIEEL